MKNLFICFIFLIFSGFTLNANNNIKLSVVELKLISRDRMFPQYYKYNIVFDLKNEGLEPLNFWTWSCSWEFVFVILDAEIGISCKSNCPLTRMILPSMCFRYNSTLYSKNKTLNKSSIILGFNYLPAYKFKRENIILQILKDYKLKERTITWNRDPLMFIKRPCFWDIRAWDGYETNTLPIIQSEF